MNSCNLPVGLFFQTEEEKDQVKAQKFTKSLTESEDASDSSAWILVKPMGDPHSLPERIPPAMVATEITSTAGKYMFLNSILDYLPELTASAVETYKFLQDFDPHISLQLIQLNQPSFDLLYATAPFLTRINLSELNIQSVPAELLCRFSEHLESINLGYNRLSTGFWNSLETAYQQYKVYQIKRIKQREKPDNHWLHSLVEFHLDHNLFEGNLPMNLFSRMKQLRRLYINENRFSGLNGIHSMQNLRVLMGDHNQFTALHMDLFKLKRLEHAYFAHNQIVQPIYGAGMRRMTNLRVIDLSYNGLVTLPGSLFALPCVQLIKADHNNVSVLPTIQPGTNLRFAVCHLVDLSYNVLVNIPIGLARVTRNLDVSHNQIRSVPASMLKWIDNKSRLESIKASELFQMDIRENPLNWPPQTVASDGIDTMMEFYYKSRTDTQIYHGLKAMFLGSSGCGKTSLVLSLLDGQCRFTDPSEEQTFGIDIFDIPFDAACLQQRVNTGDLEQAQSRPINLTIWDCSGLDVYKQMVTYFTTIPSIIVLFVDLNIYSTSENKNRIFHLLIGQWLDMLLPRSDQITVILVGTKCDLSKSDESELKRLLNQMHTDVLVYLQNRRHWFTEEIKRIEDLPFISVSLSEHYEQLNEILESTKLSMYSAALPISCTDQGDITRSRWERLLKTLVAYTLQNSSLLPNLLAPMPPVWSDIDDYLETIVHSQFDAKKSDGKKSIVMEKNQFACVIQNKFHLSSSDVAALFRYLQDTGQFYIPDLMLSKQERDYYNEIHSDKRPLPKQLVLIRPEVLLDCLKYLTNPLLPKLLTSPSEHVTTETDVTPNISSDLLRHFKCGTTTNAARRLAECRRELLRGSGIVYSDLWVALAEYNRFVMSRPYLSNGTCFIELLWRWMEMAYPTCEIYHKELAERSGMMDDLIKVNKLPPTPAEMATSAGLYVTVEEDLSARSTPIGTPTEIVFGPLPALLFPCLITTSEPPNIGSCAEWWSEACLHGPRSITPVYRFPREFPSGCYERATVRLNWPEEFKFHYVAHWKGGVQMHNFANNILIRFTLDKQEDLTHLIRFEIRALSKPAPPATNATPTSANQSGEPNVISNTEGETDAIEKWTEASSDPVVPKPTKRKHRKDRPLWHNWPISEEQLWDLVLPILKEFESVLLAYPRLCYKRLMQCPNCSELTFTGEWFTPQEVQELRYRKCPACVYKLSTCLLAPPERGLAYLAQMSKTPDSIKSKKKKKKKKHLEAYPRDLEL
ncbi:hypothetical protein PHET_05050 [Paragonimus heterotremus]|uniref:Roc domain-containing protein n=1 Tax=Paragonimus heterotremus TaxID=100268 RepID=A0A8J4SLT8_9TREM|nr:hypothetical protein PHET_05050 [Paragonimus heterotremus]